MIEFLDAHVAWWHWVAVGLLLALGEMLIPSFFLLLIGASAVVVGLLLTVLPLGFNLQLMIWAGLSALNVFLWFRVVQPRIPDRTRSGMAMETLVGQAGTLVAVNPETLRGRIRFPAPLVGSDEWECIVEAGQVLGDRVRVRAISGNNLVVGPMGAAGAVGPA